MRRFIEGRSSGGGCFDAVVTMILAGLTGSTSLVIVCSSSGSFSVGFIGIVVFSGD
jgi:hypothetical protein